MMEKKQRPKGVTLVELLVVMTIVAVFAAISFPLLQIVQQRDKENRLKEILSYVRFSGIGLGNPNDETTIHGQKVNAGYRSFMIKKIFAQQGPPTHPPYNGAEVNHAIASGIEMGDIYPLNPKQMLNPLNYVASFAYDDVPNYMYATVTQRFIKGIPPHPFRSWYPNAHWEFKAATNTVGGGVASWFVASFPEFPENASITKANDVGWWTPTTKATGVIDIRSVGAGISLVATNTDLW